MLYEAELAVVDISERPELMEKCNGFTATTFFHIAPHDPNMELMQFTGLHDKNDREIYEGDIIKFAERTEFRGMLKSGVGKVQYAENVGSFSIQVTHEDGSGIEWSLEHFVITEFEIIGNIYQNPKLLKP